MLLDPFEDLVLDPGSNGRYKPELTDVTRVRDEIIREGQLQPICVSKRPDGKWKVEMGNVRTMAIRQINDMHMTEVPLKVKAIEVPRLDSFSSLKRNISENWGRAPLNPMDIATQAYRFKHVYNMSMDDIASFYNMSKSWVDGHLKLLQLELAIQDQIATKKISWTGGRELADLDAETQELVVAISREAGEKLTPANVVKRKRELTRLQRMKNRSWKEMEEDFKTVAGSPDCSPSVRRLFEVIIEYRTGKHDVDQLSDLAFKLRG